MNDRRLLKLAGLVVVLLAACGGGGGSGMTREPVQDECNETSVLENGVCRTFAVRADERIATSFTDMGQTVSLEVVLFRPLAEGRYPTIVFHHGSTGNGSDPALFGNTFTSKSLAFYFVERGWTARGARQKLNESSSVSAVRMCVPNVKRYKIE